MFDCALSFLFSVRRSMKRRQKMDHVLQFYQQLDNLVWGAPWCSWQERDLPDASLGFTSDTLPSKAFRLIFTEDRRTQGYLKAGL